MFKENHESHNNVSVKFWLFVSVNGILAFVCFRIFLMTLRVVSRKPLYTTFSSVKASLFLVDYSSVFFYTFAQFILFISCILSSADTSSKNSLLHTLSYLIEAIFVSVFILAMNFGAIFSSSIGFVSLPLDCTKHF